MMSLFQKQLSQEEINGIVVSNSVDVGDSICIANYEGYRKLKGYFNKFIHVIDYPNNKSIDEGVGNFLVLNSETFPKSTIREIDKFAYFSRVELAYEPIMIHTSDMSSGIAIATACRTSRGCEYFKAFAEIVGKMRRATGKWPALIPEQFDGFFLYYGKKFADKDTSYNKGATWQ